MTERVDRKQIIEMLTRVARDAGLSLDRFYDLGRSDDLIDPGLRDLWLIWGDVLTEDDLTRPIPA